jgi:hypothetical protein
MKKGKLSHKEVLRAGQSNATNAAKLLKAFAKARVRGTKRKAAGPGKEFEKDERTR